MTLLNRITRNIAKAAEYNVKDPANFLKITGAIGFATSCICQTYTIYINKTIPDREKKFLIPQELADGAVNIGIFWLFASYFKNIGENLVKKARILPAELPQEFRNPDKINEILTGKGAHFELLSKYKKGMSVLTSIIGSVIAANIITPIVRNKIAYNVQKRLIKNHENFCSQKLLPPEAVIPNFNSKIKPMNTGNYNMADFLSRSRYSANNLKV